MSAEDADEDAGFITRRANEKISHLWIEYQIYAQGQLLLCMGKRSVKI